MANRIRATFTLNVKTVAKLREASAVANTPMSQLCEAAILEKVKAIVRNGQKQCNPNSPIVCLIVAILKKLLGLEQNGGKGTGGSNANNTV